MFSLLNIWVAVLCGRLLKIFILGGNAMDYTMDCDIITMDKSN